MSDVVLIELIKIGGIFFTLVIAIIGLWKGNRNSKKIQEVHVLVNSKMKEFMDLIAKSSKAEGKLEEKTETEQKVDASNKKADH